MNTVQDISITPQAHIRLKNELAALRSRPSVEVPDDLMDTAENLEDYRERRARIRQIEDLLGVAVVDDDSAGDAMAEPDMARTVRYDDTGHIETFLLSGHGAEDSGKKVDALGSPISRALTTERPGEHRTVLRPDGAIAVTLLSTKDAGTSASRRHQSRCDSPHRRAPWRPPRKQNLIHGKAHTQHSAENVALTKGVRI